jgi:tetratricopeptide (TPR) repeat protein
VTDLERAGIGNTVSGGVQLGPVLQGRDIQATFHLPAALPAALAQLPAPLAGFTGREGELAVLAGLLDPARTEDAVLISAVAGLAGVGKTTLVVQAGHTARLRGWYPGGVLFIDLHGYDETPVPPGQALDALLRALGLPAERIPPAAEERAGLYRSVLTHLGEPLLVIADNASSEAQVRLLRPGAGPHRLLVTSRHTLAGLGARLVDLTVLGETDAVALLNTALRAARPADDRISSDPGAARRLAGIGGGLPLALQITASILATDPPLRASELADELAVEQARLERLAYDDGSGTAAPSVATAFGLSYRKLADAPARLFRLLPVNPGPDVSTASAAVLMDLPATQVRALLADLARAHLVESAAGAPGRWLMHDLVRLYARRLCDEYAEADHREQARDRLLDHYLDTATAAGQRFQALPGMAAPDEFATQDDALAWLDAERPSLTAAVVLAARTGRDQFAMRLPISLHEYLDWRRRFDDLLTTLTVSRDAARRLSDRAREATAQAHLGHALTNLRRFDEAITTGQDAAAICRETGDRRGEGVALSCIGNALREVRRFDEAITALQDAAAIGRETGDRHAEGKVLNNLALALREARRFDEATTAAHDAVAILRDLGDRRRQGTALANLGGTLQLMGRPDEAIIVHQDALAMCREADDRRGEAVALTNIGYVLRKLQRFDEAIAACRDAAEIYRETGDRYGEGKALNGLGDALWEVGRFGEAITAHQDAITFYRETGGRREEGTALNGLGRDFMGVRRIAAAITAFEKAVAIFRESGDQRSTAIPLSGLGSALTAARRFGEAVTAFEEAATLFRESDDTPKEQTVNGYLETVRAADRLWRRRWLRGPTRLAMWVSDSWQRLRAAVTSRPHSRNQGSQR